MNNPEIKAGQTWKMRNGDRVTIEAILTDNGSFPVKHGHWYWQANGKYWSDDYEHSKDLISLLKPENGI